MSNNDLYCSYCKTQHHPVECPKEEEDKMNTTQKDIEIVESIKNDIIIANSGEGGQGTGELSKKKLEAIDRIKSTLEAVEKAKGVLPEKRISEKYPSVYLSTGFNACLDLSTPVVAKLIKENEKYEGIAKAQAKKIKELEAEAKMGNIPYKEAIALKEENEKLKAKLSKGLSKWQIEEIINKEMGCGIHTHEKVVKLAQALFNAINTKEK